jgi:hypothetical protein
VHRGQDIHVGPDVAKVAGAAAVAADAALAVPALALVRVQEGVPHPVPQALVGRVLQQQP